ncbi:hypothetical protein BGZ96_002240 [Linnemannia gamsii]|uniref:Fe2OG dioxygenase domain-containing protein n=1 Tax=Linnemannia gamsii TaxID=64522 RepID=A0ABQ7JKY6_9FUNG|nr:hypothetical protein BGZ96_002240 [Linnemannia gamsii]
MARPSCNDEEAMHNNNQESFLEWPRLSSPSFSSSRPAPRWTTILGPCQVLVFPQFLSLPDTRALTDYLQQEMKYQIDDKLDPTKPRPVNVPRPGYAFRDNDRIQFDSPEFASMVWNKCGLRDRWKELWEHPKYGLETTQGESITSGARNNKRIRHAVGLSRNIRMYRYQQGQSFGAHYDESVEEKDDEGNDVVSEYTVLIYLNGERDSDLIGGETVFYPKGKKPIATSGVTAPTRGGGKKGAAAKGSGIGNAAAGGVPGAGTGRASGESGLSYTLPNGGVAVKPERGLLLVHKHGDECMLHEALIVQRGYKYVLRTDVVYEP